MGFGLQLEHASSQVHFTSSSLAFHANKQVIGRIDVLRASEPNGLYHKLNYGPRSGTRDTRANSMRCVLTQTPRRHCSRRSKPFFYGGQNSRMARHSWVKTDLHMLCMEKYAAGVPWAASALGVQVLKCQLQKPEIEGHKMRKERRRPHCTPLRSRRRRRLYIIHLSFPIISLFSWQTALLKLR